MNGAPPQSLSPGVDTIALSLRGNGIYPRGKGPVGREGEEEIGHSLRVRVSVVGIVAASGLLKGMFALPAEVAESPFGILLLEGSPLVMGG